MFLHVQVPGQMSLFLEKIGEDQDRRDVIFPMPWTFLACVKEAFQPRKLQCILDSDNSWNQQHIRLSLVYVMTETVLWFCFSFLLLLFVLWSGLARWVVSLFVWFLLLPSCAGECRDLRSGSGSTLIDTWFPWSFIAARTSCNDKSSSDRMIFLSILNQMGSGWSEAYLVDSNSNKNCDYAHSS